MLRSQLIRLLGTCTAQVYRGTASARERQNRQSRLGPEPYPEVIRTGKQTEKSIVRGETATTSASCSTTSEAAVGLVGEIQRYCAKRKGGRQSYLLQPKPVAKAYPLPR